MRSMMSIVSCAMPSSRYGSYSHGRTSRSNDTPMFFMARTTAAMFTGFCGSNSTTRTRDRTDSVIDDREGEVAVLIVAIAAEVDELIRRATEHELASTAFAVGRHVVHDHVNEKWC